MVSRSDAPEFSSELELTPLVWSSLADLGRGRIGATFRSTTAVRRSYALGSVMIIRCRDAGPRTRHRRPVPKAGVWALLSTTSSTCRRAAV